MLVVLNPDCWSDLPGAELKWPWSGEARIRVAPAWTDGPHVSRSSTVIIAKEYIVANSLL